MPFFSKLIKKEYYNKKNVTLQVRIPLKIYSFCEKRVLFSTSCSKWQIKRNYWKGSLTVEAALVLPVFLFALVILMSPMKLMNENRKIQAVLESVCEEVSQYAYIPYRMSQGETIDIPADSSVNQEVITSLKNAGILLYADRKVRGMINSKAISHISFARSAILKDKEMIELIMDYQLRLPFSVLGLTGIPMTSSSNRRAWTGRDGGRGHNHSEEDADKTEELVYIGRTSSRYHRVKTCHYLYNEISAVTFESVESRRNIEGRRYRRCSRCGGGSTGTVVFIMEGGECCHRDRNCSAILAYVQAVPLSQVEQLGPCSYCSK